MAEDNAKAEKKRLKEIAKAEKKAAKKKKKEEKKKKKEEKKTKKKRSSSVDSSSSDSSYSSRSSDSKKKKKEEKKTKKNRSPSVDSRSSSSSDSSQSSDSSRSSTSGYSSDIQIQILFFASAREAAGNVSSIDLKLNRQTADTAVLREVLAEKYPKLAPLVLDQGNMTLALNEEYVPTGEAIKLKSGDVVALIPPISGG